ncbi:MAG: hypothetical protein IPP32_12240 [Bacteroidetes bacterium]|nr:hypothetical protein [Bacteroidota bacterium]
MNTIKTITLICKCCDREFIPTRMDAKFCSGACKQKAYNRRVKQNILKYGNNCSAPERQRIDRINAIEIRLEQKLKESSIAPTPATEDISKSMEAFFAKMKQDDENRKVKDANQRLKECLNEILEYSQQEEISRWRLISLCNSVERKLGTRIFSLPIGYKYTCFINDTLLPKVMNLRDVLNNSNERYVKMELHEFLEKQIIEILSQLG